MNEADRPIFSSKLNFWLYGHLTESLISNRMPKLHMGSSNYRNQIVTLLCNLCAKSTSKEMLVIYI